MTEAKLVILSVPELTPSQLSDLKSCLWTATREFREEQNIQFLLISKPIETISKDELIQRLKDA